MTSAPSRRLRVKLAAARGAGAVAAGLLLAASSACPEPYYDADIGVEGVPVAEGALAGTFAMKTMLVDQADTVLGKLDAAALLVYLVERTWDAPAGVYRERLQVCDVVNFEVAGLTSIVSTRTARSIPPIEVDLHVDHATGAVKRDQMAEIWAVRDLQHDEPVPTDPDSPRFYDMDDDGKPGATIVASGLVSGELYLAQRKRVDTWGVVRSADQIWGLADAQRESVILDVTNEFLRTEAERTPHPNPKESWLVDARLEDGADCGVVSRELTTPRLLPAERPF